ncbi:hypothetical protein BJX76DRAFT_55882 [Aspergillus varians]
MTSRKRNEFLDIVSSDDEDNEAGYDSEAAEETKGRAVKRRKTQSRGDKPESGSEEESDVSDGEESSGAEAGGVRLSMKKREQRRGKTGSQSREKNELNEDDNEVEDEDEDQDHGSEDDEGQYLDVSAEAENAKTKKTSKSVDKPKSKSSKKKKPGVVYFSTLPPYMKPFALKSVLESRGFAPITKVFLSPEVRLASAPRRRSNKRKTYADGWVEFESKKMAKICAESMNASIVGGRKGGWYHDDVLNLKYLKGFKWSDLLETVQRERSEREAKRRIEDTRARKEEKVFLQGYETGKMLDGMQKKNEEKRKRKIQAGGEDRGREEAVNARRLFKQSEVKQGRDKVQDQSALAEDTRRVLGKIF